VLQAVLSSVVSVDVDPSMFRSQCDLCTLRMFCTFNLQRCWPQSTLRTALQRFVSQRMVHSCSYQCALPITNTPGWHAECWPLTWYPVPGQSPGGAFPTIGSNAPCE
jgi:hypothetical protein